MKRIIFFSAELTHGFQGDQTVSPEIIQTSILCNFQLDNQLWKPSIAVSQEAAQYHGFNTEDLRFEHPIRDQIKLDGYVVCWTNIKKIMAESGIKFDKNKFICLDTLTKILKLHKSYKETSLTEWAKKSEVTTGLEVPEQFYASKKNKVIMLNMVFDLVCKELSEIYAIDFSKNYDILANAHKAALDIKIKKKNKKVYLLVDENLQKIKERLKNGENLKDIKFKFYKKSNGKKINI